MIIVYQKPLIQTFFTSFLLHNKPRTHIPKVIMYSKTGFKDFWYTKINLSQNQIKPASQK